MIEMLGVLAIIGVLSVGGIAGYSMAMAKFKTTKAVDQIQTITTNVRTLLAGQRRWPKEGSLKGKNWYDLGVFTDETYNSGDSGFNAYGGTIDITTGASTARTFDVAYDGIPQDACVKLGTSDWGGDAGSGLVSIEIGSTTFSWTLNNLPPSLAEVASACGNKTSNKLTWTYK